MKAPLILTVTLLSFFNVDAQDLTFNVKYCKGDEYAVVTAPDNPKRGRKATYQWSISGETSQTIRVPSQYFNQQIDVLILCECGHKEACSFNINPASYGFDFESEKRDATCNNSSTGEINLRATEGHLNYRWDDGSTSPNRSHLPAGVYTVTATNANGCYKTESFTINEPPPVDATGILIKTNKPKCKGTATGEAELELKTDNATDLRYQWEDNSSSTGLKNLRAGTHYLTVQDGAGNCSRLNFKIEETKVAIINTEFLKSYNGFATSCPGTNDAEVQVMVNEGAAPYSVKFNGKSYTTVKPNEPITAKGLAAGSYTVVITDSNNCRSEYSVNVDGPARITLNDPSVSVLCAQDLLHLNNLQVTGGAGSFAFSLASEPNKPVTELKAGNHQVIITDANGCKEKADINISQPRKLVTKQKAVSLFGVNMFIVQAKGGTPGYSMNGKKQRTRVKFSLKDNPKQNVTVVDENGCESVRDVRIKSNSGKGEHKYKRHGGIKIWTGKCPTKFGKN